MSDIELPDHWSWERIDDIGKVIPGNSPPSSTYNSNGDGLPFYQGKTEFGDIFPEPEKWCSDPKKIAEKGDVLVSVRAPVGATNICPEKSCIGRGLAAIRGSDRVNTKYVFYALTALRSSLEKKGSGTTFDSITGDQLRAFEIPVPPLDEQALIVSKIEELTSKVDIGLSELDSVVAYLSSYYDSTLDAAFSGDLSSSWRANHDYDTAEGFRNLILEQRKSLWKSRYRIKRSHYKKEYTDEELENRYDLPNDPTDSDLFTLPEDWVWSSIEQLCIVEGGLTKNSSERADYPIDIPYLRVANVYANELDLDNIKEIKIKENELEKYLLEEGDLLIVEGNGSKDQIGRVAVWDGSIEPCVHQNHLIKIRPVENQMNKYLLYWLLSNKGRRFIEKEASSTSGLYTLSLSKVRSIPVPLPPKKEIAEIINEIERRVTVQTEIKKVVTQEIERGERLRDQITRHAVAGKLMQDDLSVPDAEVDMSEKKSHSNRQMKLEEINELK